MVGLLFLWDSFRWVFVLMGFRSYEVSTLCRSLLWSFVFSLTFEWRSG